MTSTALTALPPKPDAAAAAEAGSHFRRIAMRGTALCLAALVLTLWLGRDTFRQLDSAGDWVVLGLAGVLIGLVVLGLAILSIITRRVIRPTGELARVTEAVAERDLTVEVKPTTQAGELGRLFVAVGRMVEAQRGLAGALREAATEAHALAAEILSGTGQMAAAAQQVADTASALSQEAAGMARGIETVTADAGQLGAVSDELAAGARDGLARNAHLAAVARESGQRFESSERTLQTLATGASAQTATVDALATAAEEVRTIVELLHQLARQSKLLSLNATMEAARAGEHGHGFAVVANEVGRLATSSAEAAQRAQGLVRQVLSRVRESREANVSAAATLREVIAATHEVRESFTRVEEAVRGAEEWTSAIARSASRSNELVGGVRERLDTLASGTRTFAAAMEEMAATSEQQSASTEEISAAAHALAARARQLAELVATYRLRGGES